MVKRESIEKSLEYANENIVRETMTIMVNGKPTIVYIDDIQKQLYEHIWKNPLMPLT